MQFGNYANIIQFAAALSMANYWVARTPDNPQDYPVNFNNNQLNNQQGNRYHPYAQQQQNNWAENFNNNNQNQDFGLLVQQQPNVPNNFRTYGRNELYQSKEAEDTFRAYMELQELISWQESYRRGDMSLSQPSNEQFVMPVVQNDKSKERSSTDDGYVSAIGSPASSTVSGLNNEIDQISTASSPSPPDSVFDNFELNANTPFSHVSDTHSTFDIDEILNTDDKDYSGTDSLPMTNLKEEEAKVPFSKLISSLDEGLDFVADSPLKSPGADSFLASLSPEYNPPSTRYTNTKYDPFKMQFTNSSMQEKLIADTLVDIADFDPSFFEGTSQSDEEMDKALVQSLKGKSNEVSVKTEDAYSNMGSPMVEHDYSKEDFLSKKPLTPSSTSRTNTPRYNDFPRPKVNPLQRPIPSAIPRRLTSRTFAPSVSNQRQSTAVGVGAIKKTTLTTKERSDKQLWSDFPYTTEEIINMPVEKFNEVIKQLDDIRQHVAKDVRRKGKNKLAARNCRKRKMDVIEDLDTGIVTMEQQRQSLLDEREKILQETRELQEKTEWLNRYIFGHLRDDNGIPYSANDFSLQYTSDGNVYLVPTNQVPPTKV